MDQLVIKSVMETLGSMMMSALTVKHSRIVKVAYTGFLTVDGAQPLKHVLNGELEHWDVKQLVYVHATLTMTAVIV